MFKSIPHIAASTFRLLSTVKADRNKQVSVAYVNRELACLKCMFNKAIDWDMAKENPVKKVKLFKENNTVVRYLEREEIRKLLSACPPKLKAVVTVALNTGLRKAEIQHIKWSDINIQQGFLTVHETKNGETRHVPLNKPAKDALMSVRKHPESSFVFAGEHGLPYDFRKSFETALKKSGILRFRFHDLRHCFGSSMAMCGIDLNTIREILGHKSLDMVIRYAHLSPSHKSRAVDVLGSKMDTFWTPEPSTTRELKIAPDVNSFELVG